MSIKAPIVGVKRHPVYPGRFIIKYRVETLSDFMHYFRNDIMKGHISFLVTNPPSPQSHVDIVFEVGRTRVLILMGQVKQVDKNDPRISSVHVKLKPPTKQWITRIDALCKDGNIEKYFHRYGTDLPNPAAIPGPAASWPRSEEDTNVPTGPAELDFSSPILERVTEPSTTSLLNRETIDKLFRRGRLMLSQRHLKSAKVAFQEVLQLGGNDSVLFAYYAWVLFVEGEEEQSGILESVKRALVKDPGNELANLIRGYLYKAEGKIDEAMKCFAVASSTNPNSPAKKELESIRKALVKKPPTLPRR
jgi:tetratricopeptide (TPR) repeat protein